MIINTIKSFIVLVIYFSSSTIIAAVSPLTLENCEKGSGCWKFNFNDQKCQFTASGLLTCWRGEDVEKEIYIPIPRHNKLIQARLWNQGDVVFWERELTDVYNKTQRQLISFQMSQHKILWIKNLAINESTLDWLKI